MTQVTIPPGPVCAGPPRRARRWWTRDRDVPVVGRAAVAAAPVDDIASVLATGAVQCVFQPIVDLTSGAVVAHEALARGPHGPLHTPDALFAAARTVDRVTELDELCRTVAVRSAVAHGSPTALFVNVEPSVLRTGSLEGLLRLAARAPRSLQIVLEITERELAVRPAELLSAVARLREAGWRVALDDVGAVVMSLSFLCLIAPDVVKIDMGIVQRRPDAASAALMNAVNAYAERSGAVLLAEGVETEAHLAAALGLGARLGQGWRFGRPAAAPAAGPHGVLPLPPRAPDTAPPRSPFDGLPAGAALRSSDKALLIEVSKHLERQAAAIGPSAMVLSSFQHDRYFSGDTRERYRGLATDVGFVGVFAQGLADSPLPGVRGGDLAADDPVLQEWDIVVLAPHFAAALLARDLTAEHPTPERERRFEFALTYDRAVVTAAARSLMSRIAPSV